jgi:hypothetical protein
VDEIADDGDGDAAAAGFGLDRLYLTQIRE